MYERVSKAVMNTIKSDFFPIVLSGDHSIAGATIAGIKMAKPDSRLGVVWLDAHADLHTPYTTPSGNLHGMALATALAEDNHECGLHVLDKETEKLWHHLQNIGNISPKISASDIVLISLRDFEREEKELIDKLAIKVIKTNEIRRKGSENIVRSVNLSLAQCTDIYVSFDVDCLDSSISKGTGTPVSNGLRESEAVELITKFMQSDKICGFEISEINPTLDKENSMAEIAFNILQRSVNVLLMN